MSVDRKKLVIRADANVDIGSGHMMRCLTIAKEARSSGIDVIFAVSSEVSVDLPADAGYEIAILSSPIRKWDAAEGKTLARYCQENRVDFLLVDSYAVTNQFFSGLRSIASLITVAYIDDMYTFEHGRLGNPIRRDVDVLVNYGFAEYGEQYRNVYSETNVRLCLGLAYAPVRKEFSTDVFAVKENIERVLITTGSTNPNDVLETIAEAVDNTLPEAKIDIVVGALSSCSISEPDNVTLYRGLKDLSSLMKNADMAISAAGTTLYELCAVGLPTIAIALVENQLPNLDGFERMGFGVGFRSIPPSDILDSALLIFAENVVRRGEYSERMHAEVNVNGARKLIGAIAASVDNE
ncbi:MAG: UDP-2,4-diacetamido-2,4,6-trideoxy-beta-L-altropyranose hydrolase [Raoultibacter sp.]